MDARMLQPEPGDLIAVPSSGAYCLAMASNYNMALRPAVVLAKDGDARVIQRRERYEDLLAREMVPGAAETI
jgi:diaminopimelate decarboxylase